MIRTIVAIILIFKLFSTHILAAELYTVHDRTHRNVLPRGVPNPERVESGERLITSTVFNTSRYSASLVPGA
jgi:hypothetical protein